MTILVACDCVATAHHRSHDLHISSRSGNVDSPFQSQKKESLSFLPCKAQVSRFLHPTEIRIPDNKSFKGRSELVLGKRDFDEEHIGQQEACVSDLANDASLDRSSYASLIRSCGDYEALEEGKKIHEHILYYSKFATDTFLGNLLVQMYSKCGSFKDSLDVFRKIRHRNVYSWSLMLGACVTHGKMLFALSLFQSMHVEGIRPDKVVYVTILDACVSKDYLNKGELLHAEIIESGFESDVYVGTSLVTMYGQCRSLDGSIRMFQKMHAQNVVTWNAVAATYVQNGEYSKALEFFWLMQLKNVTPSCISFLTILEACRKLEDGYSVHGYACYFGFDSDALVSTAFVTLYGKLGSLEDARELFDKIKFKTIISWNTMIASYVQHGYCLEALEIFHLIEEEPICPTPATFASVLSACAIEADLVEGQLAHDQIIIFAMDSDLLLLNALIDMYAKCGHLEDAQRIFNKMLQRDLFSWNVYIGAYALYGKGKDALLLLMRMTWEGVIPDRFTFYNILSGCSHAGLITEACLLFSTMQLEHGIRSTVEHYNCMIDLFGRLGKLDEGEDLIESMPIVPTISSWMSFLGACKMHMNVAKAENASYRLLNMNCRTAGPYVVLSHMLQLLSG